MKRILIGFILGFLFAVFTHYHAWWYFEIRNDGQVVLTLHTLHSHKRLIDKIIWGRE